MFKDTFDIINLIFFLRNKSLKWFIIYIVIIAIVTYIVIANKDIGLNLLFNEIYFGMFTDLFQGNFIFQFIAYLIYICILGFIGFYFLITIPRWIADYFTKSDYVPFNSRASAKVLK